MVRFQADRDTNQGRADNLQKKLVQGGALAATVVQSSKVPASAGSLTGWVAKAIWMSPLKGWFFPFLSEGERGGRDAYGSYF